MSMIEPDIQQKMMVILKSEETRTDLENLAVLSRVGMKVASALSAELDADATSASSTALIDLGLRLSQATNHGALKEIILHNSAGYSILMAINDEYIVFGGLKNPWRIAYYLGYLRELAKKLNILISGGEITEMTLKLQEEELEQITKQQKKQEDAEAAARPVAPTVDADKAALDDLLGFLDDWEKEGIEDFDELETEGTIVGIPKSLTVGIPKAGEDEEIPEEDFGDLELPGGSVGLDTSGFKVYPDEVPPVPLEDYTPMEIEDEEETAYHAPVPKETKPAYVYEPEEEIPSEFPSFDELPSFDDLNIPDFEALGAAEYDTDFVLGKESKALDDVLKDLGYDDED